MTSSEQEVTRPGSVGFGFRKLIAAKILVQKLHTGAGASSRRIDEIATANLT